MVGEEWPAINRAIARAIDTNKKLDKTVKVPRFLLNDIVRYWRTVTVDFVEKQRGQAGHGWGLRNAKLRMSRKLIFATGC